VISTPSKTGTTWAQMICALLIFGEPQLPAPLGRLSPWLDHLVAPREEVYGCWPPSSTGGSSRRTPR
jgi:aryl sulfotransferase